MTRPSVTILSVLIGIMTPLATIHAEQFVLFDETFTFAEKDAVPTKSHLRVFPDQFGPETPDDWTAPVDYRNGSVHIRIEVLSKPKGELPSYWSLCYIPVQGQKNNYGCINSPTYTQTGVYEKDQSMTEFWNNDSIVWTEGIKHMSLVLKGPRVNGKSHAHLQPDMKAYFPTRVRFTMVQVSKGATYDPSMLNEYERSGDDP
ncbi:MAG: hypothetical protein AAGC97_12345 [Planctomycetota bacterium]